MVSALGSDGPDAALTAFDLIAQALSGLLLADARPGDEIPRRAGGLAMADFTAGLLAAVSTLAALVGRDSGRGDAPGLEVSLLGAALAVQAQRFVSVGVGRRGVAERPRAGDAATTSPSAASAPARRRSSSRTTAPTAPPTASSSSPASTRRSGAPRCGCSGSTTRSSPIRRRRRRAPGSGRRGSRSCRRFEATFAEQPSGHWIRRLRAAGVPAAPVRTLDQVFDDPQARANGLVQQVATPAGRDARLLGGLFKVDGEPAGARRGVPALGEHTAEVLAEAGA